MAEIDESRDPMDESRDPVDAAEAEEADGREVVEELEDLGVPGEVQQDVQGGADEPRAWWAR